MKRYTVFLFLLVALICGSFNIVYADVNSVSINTDVNLESTNYIKIEKALNIDCKKGDVLELTQYLGANIEGFSAENIYLEFINTMDGSGNNFWICYGIRYNGVDTNFKLWVKVWGNEIEYENRWNGELIEKLMKQSPVSFSRLEIEKIKDNYTLWFDDETQSITQSFNIEFDEKFRVIVNMGTVYLKVGFIANDSVHYYSNMDLIEERFINLTPSAVQNEPFLSNSVKGEIDCDIDNSQELATKLSQIIPNFNDYMFEIDIFSPFETPNFYFNRGDKQYFYRLNQYEYVVYTLKYKDFITPYKIIVTSKDGKVQYETNIGESTLRDLEDSYVLNNVVISQESISKAIEQSDKEYSEIIQGSNFEHLIMEVGLSLEEVKELNDMSKVVLVNQSILAGVDDEHRPYIDVESNYQQSRSGRIITSAYRFYVSY